MDASTIMGLLESGLLTLPFYNEKRGTVTEGMRPQDVPLMSMLVGMVDKDTDLEVLYGAVKAKVHGAYSMDWPSDGASVDERKKFYAERFWGEVKVSQFHMMLVFWAFLNAPDRVPEIVALESSPASLKESTKNINMFEKMFGIGVKDKVNEYLNQTKSAIKNTKVVAIGNFYGQTPIGALEVEHWERDYKGRKAPNKQVAYLKDLGAFLNNPSSASMVLLTTNVLLKKSAKNSWDNDGMSKIDVNFKWTDMAILMKKKFPEHTKEINANIATLLPLVKKGVNSDLKEGFTLEIELNFKKDAAGNYVMPIHMNLTNMFYAYRDQNKGLKEFKKVMTAPWEKMITEWVKEIIPVSSTLPKDLVTVIDTDNTNMLQLEDTILSHVRSISSTAPAGLTAETIKGE